MPRRQLQERAAHFYQKALPGLGPLKKERAEKRLQECQASAAKGPTNPSGSRTKGTPSVASPKAGRVVALADSDEAFRRHWKGPAKVFFDPQSKSLQIKGIFELGTFEYPEPWKAIYFEVAPKDVHADRFRVFVNGTMFDIGKSIGQRAMFVPVAIQYDEAGKMAIASVAGMAVEKATILQGNWSRRLSLLFRHENWDCDIYVRNVQVLVDE